MNLVVKSIKNMSLLLSKECHSLPYTNIDLLKWIVMD